MPLTIFKLVLINALSCKIFSCKLTSCSDNYKNSLKAEVSKPEIALSSTL